MCHNLFGTEGKEAIWKRVVNNERPFSSPEAVEAIRQNFTESIRTRREEATRGTRHKHRNASVEWQSWSPIQLL